MPTSPRTQYLGRPADSAQHSLLPLLARTPFADKDDIPGLELADQ